MKNSKEYAQKIRSLYRSLKQKYSKPRPPVYEDPIEALIYGIISENTTSSAADAIIKRFKDYFVDLNDLRVSRVEEIVEVLGQDNQASRDTALNLTKALRAVFDKYNQVSLKALKKIGKKSARQTLEKLNAAGQFAIDYCMLTALQAHSIPLTQKMVDYLVAKNVVHPDADMEQIKGFLARQIPARNAYEFYALLRAASESRRTTKRKRSTEPKAKTTKKAKRKK